MIISGLINFTLGIALESSRKKAPPLYDVRLDDLPFFRYNSRSVRCPCRHENMC